MAPANRAVFRELLRRELDERWRGSVLGASWLLLLPLLQLAVLAWVFGSVLPSRAAGGSMPYAAFLALGLWPWNLLANAANRGVTALTDNASLIGKVAVPHGLYVDSRVAGTALLEIAGFAVVLAALPLFGVGLEWSGLPLLLPALALVALWALALARVLAVLQVFLRDIGAVISALLSLGFFLAPVLYDRAALPPALGDWLVLNPATVPIEAIRAALTGAGIDWAACAGNAAAAVVVLWLATRFQRAARSHLEDFL